MADRDSPWLSRAGTPVEQLPDPFGPATAPPHDEPAPSRRRRVRWLRWGLTAFFALLLVTVLWLVFTAPLGRALEPLPNPAMLIVSADGQAIARRGSIKEAPVAVARLNRYTPLAFVAIEDRRFYSHWGIDPRSIGRALLTNLHAGGVRQGGSTITQQLAKTSFLSSDRNLKRKAQEVIIAFWLEAWLTKDEILSRYLSSVYFGDGVYGLRAAAHHYFGRDPEKLTLAQSAMLAGMVQAPSRLAPTHNLAAAQRRSRLVLQEMADTGVVSLARARAAASARPVIVDVKIPTGTYFADWVAPQAADAFAADFGEIRVRTTLDSRLQRLASRAIGNASIAGAQAALVAMRPDGRVVAMVGGTSYKASPFNRATQGRRQPGSTFKLFVYLAALRSGWTPDSKLSDTPITIDGWSPTNSDGVYRGDITVKEAFARSSNAASVRLSEAVGRQNVLRAARDLGISTALPNTPSVALGSAGVSLLELTSAYAAIAGGRYPVRASGLPPQQPKDGTSDNNLSALLFTPGGRLDRTREWKPMLDLLWAAANEGTGKRAALATPTFGKTGTSQDNRDALFVGFAGDLVVGVWVGRDDNKPMAHSMSGGAAPAEIWRAFMSPALALDGRNATSLPGDYQPPRRLPPPDRKSPLPANWDVDPGAWVNDLVKDAQRLLDRL